MNGDVGMYHAKNSGNKKFPDKGVTHDCASILDSIAKGTSCFHYFSHGTSLHRHSFSRMIFTLVSHIFIGNAVTRMRTLAPRLAYA